MLPDFEYIKFSKAFIFVFLYGLVFYSALDLVLELIFTVQFFFNQSDFSIVLVVNEVKKELFVYDFKCVHLIFEHMLSKKIIAILQFKDKNIPLVNTSDSS